MLTRKLTTAYTFIFPTVLALGGLIFYPLVYNLWLSFYKVSLTPGEPPTFVGFGNYINLVTASGFGEAFANSFIFTFFTVVGSILVGLGVALVLNEKFKGNKIIKIAALLPYITPVIAAAMAWKFILHPVFGVVNYVFVDIIPLFSEPIPWTSSPQFGLPTVIIFDIWRFFPFAFLFILAGLKAIDKNLYDAAKIDGASTWQSFLNVTLPQLKYILGVIFLIRWMWNFNKFTDIYLLTENVEVLPVFLYELGFTTYNLGLAAAVATILFLLLMVLVIPYIQRVFEW